MYIQTTEKATKGPDLKVILVQQGNHVTKVVIETPNTVERNTWQLIYKKDWGLWI